MAFCIFSVILLWMFYLGISAMCKLDEEISRGEESTDIRIGEVVYTKTEKCVLDIGWVESLKPLKIRAPYSVYKDHSGKYKRYYKNQDGVQWYGSGIYKSSLDWGRTSFGKHTPELCNDLGIKYWL